MMKEKIQNICENICNKKLSVSEELIKSDFLDSYGIMELIDMLEKEFQIIFSLEEISDSQKFSCIKKISETVMKKIV